MALTFMPGHLSDRAEFYHQAASMVNAGFGLHQIIHHFVTHPPVRSYRRPLTTVSDALQQGMTFSESVRRAGDWLPGMDIALIEAGENSGRLEENLRLLAEYYRERAALLRQVIMGVAYPLFLIHAAVILLSVRGHATALINCNFGPFLLSIGSKLGLLYLVIVAIVYLSQSSRGPVIRSAMESLFGAVPIIGVTIKELYLARLSACLEALLNAGVNIVPAWEMAARSSGSFKVRKIVEDWPAQVDMGITPAQLVREAGWFPEHFCSMYNSGELSGKLDDHLKRLYRHYAESSSHRLAQLTRALPVVIFLVVALTIAYHVVSFWAGYFNQVNEIIQ